MIKDEMIGARSPMVPGVFESVGVAELAVLDVEAAGQPPKRPSPKRSHPIEFTKDVTLARGAPGFVAVTCCTIELPTDGAATDPRLALGRPTMIEEIMGARLIPALGMPALVGVDADDPVATGHPPRRPRPSRSQPIEFTKDVTLAKGAPRAVAVTCPTIELAADEASIGAKLALGIALMMDDMMGIKLLLALGRAPRADVETAGPVAAGHPPSKPRPSKSQPMELTREVTLANGAPGTVAETWRTIELPIERAFVVAKAEVGSPLMMEEMMGCRLPTGAGEPVVRAVDVPAFPEVEPAGQPPSRPRPKISQPIEFTRDVTLANGAPGVVAVTCWTMELPKDRASVETSAVLGNPLMMEDIMGTSWPTELGGLIATELAEAAFDGAGVEPAEHRPSRPRPRMSQPMELTRDVTLAKGALGSVAVTC